MQNPSKPTLLVVADANETHRLTPFRPLAATHNIVVLHDKLYPLKSEGYKAIGSVVFWQDFPDALTLLERLRPRKVVWYLAEAYVEIALCVACKQLDVRTFHLEHGLRDSTLTRKVMELHPHLAPPAGPAQRILGKLKNLSLARLQRKFWQRRFLNATLARLDAEKRAFLAHYLQIRAANSIFDTFRQVNSPLRVADEYISFSPQIFAFHQAVDHLKPDYSVHYIGNPSFDPFVLPEQMPTTPTPDAWAAAPVLMIDQPVARDRLFGWELKSRQALLAELSQRVTESDRLFFLKPHPGELRATWESLPPGQIADDAKMQALLQHPLIVLGHWSTLLMPLSCFPNAITLCLENHPMRTDFKPSSFLTEAGVATRLDTVEDLNRLLADPAALLACWQGQSAAKAPFLEKWLFALDGKASGRLQAILSA